MSRAANQPTFMNDKAGPRVESSLSSGSTTTHTVGIEQPELWECADKER
jgi:hypothetical protein